MPQLTLVRHGQSVYNLENRFTGNLDVALTPLGEQEAHQAGIKLRGVYYTIAYTSTLKRAQETLRIILEEIEQSTIQVERTPAFDERKYGSLQGLNKSETALKYGDAQVDLWRRSYVTRPPDGESLEDTYNRAVPYYKTNVEGRLKAGENILIVAHGNSLRALMMYLEAIDEETIATVNIRTGTPRNYLLDKDLKILNVGYL